MQITHIYLYEYAKMSIEIISSLKPYYLGVNMPDLYSEHCKKLKKFWEENDFLNEDIIVFVRGAEECLEDGKTSQCARYLGRALEELEKLKSIMDGIPPVIEALEQIKVEIETLS